jgi:hypothetical protein
MLKASIGAVLMASPSHDELLYLEFVQKGMEANLKNEKYKTQIVKVERPGTNYTRTKQFEGRWIIRKFASEGGSVQYSVAETKHGRIVITSDSRQLSGDDRAEDFQVFSDLVDLEIHNAKIEQGVKEGDIYPEDLLKAIAIELGEEHIEVLDM